MSEQSDQLIKQALQARRDKRLDDAKRDLVEAVALCREGGARGELARALADLGQIERDLGHSDAALRHYEEAVAFYRAEGNPLKLAHTIRHVGDIQRHEGAHRQAEGCYCEALRIYREHRETPPLDLANALRGVGAAERGSGRNSGSAGAMGGSRRDLCGASYRGWRGGEQTANAIADDLMSHWSTKHSSRISFSRISAISWPALLP